QIRRIKRTSGVRHVFCGLAVEPGMSVAGEGSCSAVRVFDKKARNRSTAAADIRRAVPPPNPPLSGAQNLASLYGSTNILLLSDRLDANWIQINPQSMNRG